MRAGGVDVRCDGCGSQLRVRFDSNGMGGTVELVQPCPNCRPRTAGAGTAKPQRSRSTPDAPRPQPGETEEEARRRRAGICRWCDQPVDGKKKMASFCAKHRRTHGFLKQLRRPHRLKVPNGSGGKVRRGHCKRCDEDFRYQKQGKVPSICPSCNDELEEFADRVGFNLRRK